MKVEFVKENPDGGADYVFSLAPEEVETFVRIGIIAALTKAIDEAKEKEHTGEDSLHWHALNYRTAAPQHAHERFLALEDYVRRSSTRPWIGLTDEEIDQGLLRSHYALKTAGAWLAGAVFAMARLKEKNA